MMDLRKEIREKRKSLKITQESMARKMGVSKTHYANFENGRNNITDPLVKRIMAYLNLGIIVIDKDKLV
jgi:transcriptional regulator with XRE-family HTH domain